MIGLFDASAVIPLFTEEEATRSAREAFRSSERCIGLDLTLAEVANGFWRKKRLGFFTAAQASLAAREAHALFQAILPTEPLMSAALDMALRLDHPVYDCLYAVAAQREGARLVTADRRFADRLAGEPVEVLLLDA